MNQNENFKRSEVINKNSYALNLNELTLERLVSKIESDISDNIVKLNKKESEFRELEKMYFAEKEIYDKIVNDINQDELLLEGLVRFRGNNIDKKTIRILRTTSHNDDKHKNENRATRESWIKPAVAVLEKENRFLKPEEIFDKIIIMFPELIKKVTQNSALSTVKLRVTVNILRSAKLGADRKLGKVMLREYKDFVGLDAWMAGDVPTESKMKQFMFTGNNEQKTRRLVKVG